MPSRLRSDIQFQALEIDSNGQWLYQIYDPVSENYYKVNQQVYQVIQHFSVAKDILDLENQLAQSNTPATKEEIMQVVGFLKKNKLTFNETANQNPSLANRLIKSYLFFKIPLCRPDRFLTQTRFIGHLFFNKYTVYFAMLLAIWGFLLLMRVHENFLEGITASLNLTAIKYFVPALLTIKIIHELSHAYTAKIHGCKVRSLGVAFIFMTPRFYTDVSDIVTLNRKSRIKIALAGMWVEFIIAGFACFIFASSPLHSSLSQISISFITVSLVSTIFFNGNPFMKFDGYYVLKEILKTDNLYSNSSLAIKAFWRKIILGLKPEHAISLILLTYGHLSLLYRIFLYSLIVAIVYHFFIPAIGVSLAIIEIWIFLVKPVINEIIYLYHKRQVISVPHKLFAGLTLAGFISLFCLEINIPISTPAFYVSGRTQIRAEARGEIVAITTDSILLKSPEITSQLKLLKNDQIFIKLRQRQMLAQGNYALLSLLHTMEERVVLSLEQQKNELSKMSLALPEKARFFDKPQSLIGRHVKAGDNLAYIPQAKMLYVYFDSKPKREIIHGDLFFDQQLRKIPCRLISRTEEPVKYIPQQLSLLHGGQISTDTQYRPLKPFFRISYLVMENIQDYDSTAHFVWYRKISLGTEIKNVVAKFWHDEFF